MVQEDKKKEMEAILKEMKSKLLEMEDLRKKIKLKELEKIEPTESRAMLEEIKVPSLSLIKEGKA